MLTRLTCSRWRLSPFSRTTGSCESVTKAFIREYSGHPRLHLFAEASTVLHAQNLSAAAPGIPTSSVFRWTLRCVKSVTLGNCDAERPFPFPHSLWSTGANLMDTNTSHLT